MAGVQNRLHRELRPLVALADVTLAEAAQAVVSHVRRMTNSRGGVGYVAIHRGAIYVVHGDSPRADSWTIRRDMQHVGCYSMAVREAMVLEDLAACLAERPLIAAKN